MVVPWICVSISKSQVIWGKPKKNRFLHFPVSLSKEFSSGRQSDTIEDWRLAHSSFRRLCSTVFKTHAEVSDTFKNMGLRPPQSQLIRICATQKSCFLTTFFRKILVLTHFDTTYPTTWYTSLESYGSHASCRLAPTRQSWTCRPSDFW